MVHDPLPGDFGVVEPPAPDLFPGTGDGMGVGGDRLAVRMRREADRDGRDAVDGLGSQFVDLISQGTNQFAGPAVDQGPSARVPFDDGEEGVGSLADGGLLEPKWS